MAADAAGSPALTVEFYEDSAGEWRWRAQTANGRVVADSAEGYEHEDDAIDIANRLFRPDGARGGFAVTFTIDHGRG